MFGIRYNLTCPFCGKQYRVDRGGTAIYKIANRGNDNTYVKEICDECGTSYFRISLATKFIEMKLDGKTLDECIEEAIKIRTAEMKGLFIKDCLPQSHIDLIVEECNMIYSINNHDFNIKCDTVNQEDVSVYGAVFY